MSSFFRSANDVTSTSEEDTSHQSESDSSNQNDQEPDILGRITTLSSDNAEDPQDVVRSSSSERDISSYQEQLPIGDAGGHQSFLLHALLEERCYGQALEHLNRRSDRHFIRDDPEVQEEAKRLYDDLCHHLMPRGLLPHGPEQDRFRGHREGYRQGLNLLSRGLSHDGRRNALSRSASSSPLPPALQRVFEGSSSSRSGSPASALLGDSTFGKLSLAGTPDLPTPFDGFTSHQMLHMSRYGTEFTQLDRIGRGGYGEVFAVRHKIDGAQYAIKKIPIGNSRLQKIKDRGQSELDALFNELRVLARLDHPNVVRYYNGWLETSSVILPAAASGSQASAGAQQQLLLMDRDHEFEYSTPNSRELHLETRKGSIDIVFEHSEAGVEPIVHFQESPSTEHRRSETFSSTTSRKSTVEDEVIDDEVIELPRELANTTGTDSSVGLVSDLTGPAAQIPASVLTLHLQMSLHPLTLADYVAYQSDAEHQHLTLMNHSPSPPSSHSSLRHCFHTVVSVLIMLSLLDGVEYLHNESLVHRDLKPANIFLTPSPRPSYSCAKPCSECSSTQPLHLNVRIGDFGLVTALAQPEIITQDRQPRKAVGTQHYRPVSNDDYAAGDARLDIFALGVIFFELLWPFATRMERHDTLETLRSGALPADFADRIGSGGHSISQCILTMLDGASRMSCADVKKRLHGILEQLEE